MGKILISFFFLKQKLIILMYCFSTSVHHLCTPWEMCTQFGDPSCISHHTSFCRLRDFWLYTDVSGSFCPSLVGWDFWWSHHACSRSAPQYCQAALSSHPGRVLEKSAKFANVLGHKPWGSTPRRLSEREKVLTSPAAFCHPCKQGRTSLLYLSVQNADLIGKCPRNHCRWVESPEELGITV